MAMTNPWGFHHTRLYGANTLRLCWKNGERDLAPVACISPRKSGSRASG